MATTKITNPDLFDLGSLDTALKLPSGTTAERPTSPSTGEWRYNTTTNLVEFWDGGAWRELQSEDIPPINSENFNVVLYTGTGSAQSITGVGFQPDMVWIKDRIQAYSHNITDTTRGTSKQIFPNSSNAQDTTYTNRVTSFDADGFTIGNDNYVNTNGNTFVAWCWKASGGTTSSNTDGTITSTVQANTKAAFSIIEYTGTGANATVGHGLSSAPTLVIAKRLNSAQNWLVGTSAIGFTKYLELNDTRAEDTASTPWNNTAPTSTVVNFGTSSLGNGSGDDYIMYCFHDVAGYSKFGTYTGNGSAGNEQNTGFEPAFVLIKRTDSAGAWSLYDNKRSPSNPRDKKLVPNSDAAENNAGTTYQLNFLTNGFNFLGGGVDLNANGGTFLYIAFASDPSTAPVLANSFNTKLYTGTGSTQSITGLGFSPNFSWLKSRSNATSNVLHDTVRGPLSRIFSNSTAAASTIPDGFVSFDSDGFTLDGTGSGGDVNTSGRTYVAWNWKANPIPTINTDGTIQSIVSANQAAGFSIVKYTGNETSNQTVGHGLSAAPEISFIKQLDGGREWQVPLFTETSGDYLILNSTNAEATDTTRWSAVSSTTFTVGAQPHTNGNGSPYIAYCFHSVSGYSKIGSYTGNSGTLSVNVGFEADFVMVKKYSGTSSWFVFDSLRGDYNRLFPDLSNAESFSGNQIALTSTGFTSGNGGTNVLGEDYIYMAFKIN